MTRKKTDALYTLNRRAAPIGRGLTKKKARAVRDEGKGGQSSGGENSLFAVYSKRTRRSKGRGLID